MQTITLHADKNTIDKLLEFISANKLNIKIDKQDKIRDELLKDINDYKNGKLEVSPLGSNWKYLNANN
ncbi:hypothetical protein [Campylobacter ureolyticus]|uniref:hypothetical protein n=1 Tax=Campylobacter ureolyticus TaxID=827 RepID=UPI00046A6BF1|nr:hypothetical protein [Campylobacter ureolyticus]MDU5325849.1 hypothetical protein [Campylobacter ureolyticus]QIX86601.1 hypothetical protein FOB81_04615 [Campylobacter ureolyticus]STA71111.1 Uncharacterised protein [Campylobacter ureolyticus]